MAAIIVKLAFVSSLIDIFTDAVPFFVIVFFGGWQILQLHVAAHADGNRGGNFLSSICFSPSYCNEGLHIGLFFSLSFLIFGLRDTVR
jgi:hypothetical protein